MDPAGTVLPADQEYLIQGTGLDRDRRITLLEKIRGWYHSNFDSLGTVVRSTATKTLARNGDTAGWLDLTATFAASESTSRAVVARLYRKFPLYVDVVFTGSSATTLTHRVPMSVYSSTSGVYAVGLSRSTNTLITALTVNPYTELAGSSVARWALRDADLGPSTVAAYPVWDIDERVSEITFGFNNATTGVHACYVGFQVLETQDFEWFIPLRMKSVAATGAIDFRLYVEIIDSTKTNPVTEKMHGGWYLPYSTTVPFRGLMMRIARTAGVLQTGIGRLNDFATES